MSYIPTHIVPIAEVRNVSQEMFQCYGPGRHSEFAVSGPVTVVHKGPSRSFLGKLDSALSNADQHMREKGISSVVSEMGRKIGTSIDMSLAGGSAKHFQKIFGLPQTEPLIHSYNCTLLCNTSLQSGCGVTGIIYISPNFISFQSDSGAFLNKEIRAVVGGASNQVSISVPFKRIARVCQTTLNITGSSSSGLYVQSIDGFEFIFYGFLAKESFANALHEAGAQLCIQFGLPCPPPAYAPPSGTLAPAVPYPSPYPPPAAGMYATAPGVVYPPPGIVYASPYGVPAAGVAVGTPQYPVGYVSPPGGVYPDIPVGIPYPPQQYPQQSIYATPSAGGNSEARPPPFNPHATQ